MTVPVIAIVGYSNTGKTTTASALVAVLTRRGYRIAAVKHAHGGHRLEPALKDSEKLFAAGAAKVITSSSGQVSATERVEGDLSLEGVLALAGDGYDLVVAEGYKGSSAPKVLVIRPGIPLPQVDSVIAWVTDGPAMGDVPAFSPNQMEELADFLVARLVRTVQEG
ncbi:MAG: molybdopterin-guanine dinucleotide biosynthesis protein B [Chloroflexi bacterium]|nr:molybdopterin-guanine dinucleotide biosynthesis protein B [Chloroflexota bacterium]